MPRASSVTCIGLCLACLAASLPAPLAAGEEDVVDRVVRYVNTDIITAADQWELVRFRLERMKRERQPLPRDEAAWEAFRAETLEDLTVDLLKEQAADQMGVQIDTRMIKQEIRRDARRNGWDLATQSRMIELQIKRQKVRALEGYFSTKAEAVGPSELAVAYAERTDEFTRPARYRPYRLLLRPTGERELRATFELLLSVFRGLQEANHPALQAVVDQERRSAYIEAAGDQAAQLEVLTAVAEAALIALPEGADGADAKLLERARTGLEQRAAARSPADVERILTALRAELEATTDPAERKEAFAAAARRISQGPKADAGGDLGWLEPGQAGEPYDAAIAELETGALSPVLRDGEAHFVLLLAEREDARRRSLAEVSAELRTQLERERRQAAIERLEDSLRKRAFIDDLDPLSVEDIQAAAGVEDNAEDMQEQVERQIELQAPELDALAE